MRASFTDEEKYSAFTYYPPFIGSISFVFELIMIAKLSMVLSLYNKEGWVSTGSCCKLRFLSFTEDLKTADIQVTHFVWRLSEKKNPLSFCDLTGFQNFPVWFKTPICFRILQFLSGRQGMCVSCANTSGIFGNKLSCKCARNATIPLHFQKRTLHNKTGWTVQDTKIICCASHTAVKWFYMAVRLWSVHMNITWNATPQLTFEKLPFLRKSFSGFSFVFSCFKALFMKDRQDKRDQICHRNKVLWLFSVAFYCYGSIMVMDSSHWRVFLCIAAISSGLKLAAVVFHCYFAAFEKGAN